MNNVIFGVLAGAVALTSVQSDCTTGQCKRGLIKRATVEVPVTTQAGTSVYSSKPGSLPARRLRPGAARRREGVIYQARQVRPARRAVAYFKEKQPVREVFRERKPVRRVVQRNVQRFRKAVRFVAKRTPIIRRFRGCR